MSIDELVGGPARSTRALSGRAKVTKAPAGPTSPLSVVLTGYTAAYEFEVPAGNWAAGGGVPAVGDGCLVVFDEDGDAWVPVFSNETSLNETPLVFPASGDVFTQSTPAVVWTITHARAVPPAVTVVDLAGNKIEPDVRYPTSTSITLTFGRASTGQAFLNIAGSSTGGAGTTGVLFVQGVPASTWTITHDRTVPPSVTVVDTNDSQIEPDAMYSTATSITLTFGGAVSGRAFLN